ncbi:MAG TPA: hypothetical protein VGR69_01725 [Candidatus Rubrimentiphilum sp.]|nr:hypothetical protein [Candidatus Rubrimentiphilum sp.]
MNVASVAKIAGTGERIAVYDVPDDQMAVGSTLGAPKITLIIKSTGAIEKIYSPDCGQTMIGTIVVHHWDADTGIALRGLSGKFYIHPDRQDHVFQLANGVEVRESIFALNSKPVGDEIDPPAAYYVCQLNNDTERTVTLASYAFAELKGSVGPDLEVRYDARRHAFVITNRSDTNLARIFGSTEKPQSYEVSGDHGKAGSETDPGSLSNSCRVEGFDPLGIFRFVHRLKPGERVELCFKVSLSAEGAEKALAHYDATPKPADAQELTRNHFDAILDRTVLITPDSEVNRGVLWAKANMLRILLRAPTGWCFTNDPTRSNNSVARDTAWFAMGADYIYPIFARHALRWYIDHLEPSGMVVEYYDVRSGEPADYKMNINDDTPLLILALWHHYNTTGDRAFLEEIYPNAVKAARYILSQRDDRGLVWCTADGTADYGIVGWRNVIEDYRLSGASTELNSECYAAFLNLAQMAHVLGKNDAELEFRGHADALRDAINTHLFDKERQLYHLSIDLDGSVRTDITCDLIFPVMFGVAEDGVAAHIISKLSVAEFWTEAGIRTVPRTAPMYSPTAGQGLLGGVWGNVTFWFAMAAARFNPEFMAYALSSSFRHYSQDPRRNNTVPGQFSEWLHGEMLTNQGMMLSPWFPPHYLWAAIEGAAGFNLSRDEPSVTPRLAPDWKWLGVRNVFFGEEKLTWFVVRAPQLRMYATFAFKNSIDTSIYKDDCTDTIELTGEAAAAIALRREDGHAIMIGNTTERTVRTALRVNFKPAFAKDSYGARVFNSLRGEWVEAKISAEELSRGLPLELDRKGFCVLELR